MEIKLEHMNREESAAPDACARFTEPEPLGRRAWFLHLCDGALAAGALLVSGPLGCWSCAADEKQAGLIVRSPRPLDLETPVEAFDQWLTPNRLFFVRSHFGAPAVTLAPWRLEIEGPEHRVLALDLDDLKPMEQVTVRSVLQCSGNGRGFFEPIVPGVRWERGAVGNADWTGVRLSDLLERAGLRGRSGHVHLLGADAPPSAKTPAFQRSIPIDRAVDPNTLVATQMNGEALPWLQGGPMRLVVPGWTGNHWVKWLRRISVAPTEAGGFYMQTAYRMPRSPVPPGVDVKPDDLVPVTALNVKSLIVSPLAGARLPAGKHEVRGVAWTGAGHVTRVELSTGGDSTWQNATLLGDARPYSWRLWRSTWNAQKPGRYLIRVRATDSNGQVQPETTTWNKSGYLWNGIDEVSCEIR